MLFPNARYNLHQRVGNSLLKISRPIKREVIAFSRKRTNPASNPRRFLLLFFSAQKVNKNIFCWDSNFFREAGNSESIKEFESAEISVQDIMKIENESRWH